MKTNKQNHLLNTLHLEIDKEKIAFLKFLLEGYDGLCILTTTDAKQGKIKLVAPESRFNELNSVVKNIAGQLDITQPHP